MDTSFESYAETALGVDLDTTSERRGEESLGVCVGERRIDLGNAESQDDERPGPVAIEKIGTTELKILDVNVDRRVIRQEALRIRIGTLARIQNFILAIGVSKNAERNAFGVRIINVDAAVAILFVKASAHPVADVGCNLEAKGIVLSRSRCAETKRDQGKSDSNPVGRSQYQRLLPTLM